MNQKPVSIPESLAVIGGRIAKSHPTLYVEGLEPDGLTEARRAEVDNFLLGEGYLTGDCPRFTVSEAGLGFYDENAFTEKRLAQLARQLIQQVPRSHHYAEVGKLREGLNWSLTKLNVVLRWLESKGFFDTSSPCHFSSDGDSYTCIVLNSSSYAFAESYTQKAGPALSRTLHEQASSFRGAPVFNIGQMNNSSLSFASEGGSISNVLQAHGELSAELCEMLSELKKQVAKMDMPAEDAAEMECELVTFESQISSPKPKTAIIQYSLDAMKRLAEAAQDKAAAIIIARLVQIVSNSFL